MAHIAFGSASPVTGFPDDFAVSVHQQHGREPLNFIFGCQSLVFAAAAYFQTFSLRLESCCFVAIAWYGKFIGNTLGGAILPDIICGSLATLIGACFTYRLREKKYAQIYYLVTFW